MFIVVESGSTKADWVVVNGPESNVFYKTNGINPATQIELLDLYSHPELLSPCQSQICFHQPLLDQNVPKKHSKS